MKNGDFNKTEELLQKRFDGVKNDIKDPGFVKIEYREKEKKESFFQKPAVYAAGLVLIAVLVCGGTFAGLKILERIGAQNVASSSTPSLNENSETAVDNSDVTEETVEIKGYYPVYLRITCGGKREYLPSYLIWESVNDGKTENITQTSITSKDYEDMDNIPVFDIKDFEIGYGRVYADGMEATVKCRMAGRDGTFDIDDICDILTSSYPGVYRFIAVVNFKTVSDGVTREGCYEYPFDINYVYEQSSDSAEVTEPDDVPVSFGIGSGNLCNMFNPVLHSVITDAGTEIVETGEPGNVWTVVIKGRENFGFVFSNGVDFISATADKDGVILFETDIQADAESKMLQLWDGGATDFTVTVYMSKQTEGETRIYRGAFIPVFEDADETTENTEEPVSNIGDYNGDFFVTVGDVRIHPDAYMLWEIERNNKTGSVERKTGTGANGKLENVLKITYKDSLGVGYTGGKSTGIHKGEMTEITYRYAGRSGMTYDDMRAYLDGSGSGTYRIVADVVYSVTSGDITYRGVYEFPFDVIVLKPEVTEGPEPLQIVLTNHDNREYSYYVGKHAGDGELFNVYLKNASNLASVSVTVSWDERLELTRAEYPTRPDWYPDDLFYETCKKNHSYTFEWKADDPADAVSGDFLLMRLDFDTPEHVASAFNIDFTVNTSGTYNTAGQNIPSSSKRIPIETVYEQLEWPESIPETDPEPETDPVTDTEETAPHTEDMPYQVYIVRHQSGMLEAADTSTTRYNGENLLKRTEIYKKDVPGIKLNLLGYERDLRFLHTDVIYAYGKTLDCYITNNNVECVYIDHDTGKIVMYDSTGNTKDKYESPVNAYSSREEFVNYAKELLLEYTGLSAEGCEVRIETVGIRTTYKYTQDEIIDGFANFTKYDPDFYAEYDITFYKKINGVNRADVMRVMMKNNGVVEKIFGIELDDVYEPYLDTEIDADSITKYVESQMDLLKEKYDIRSQKITLTAIQVDGCYWVQADLRYTFMREYDGKLTSAHGVYLILIDGDFENPDYPYDYDMYIEYVYEYDPGDDTQFE